MGIGDDGGVVLSWVEDAHLVSLDSGTDEVTEWGPSDGVARFVKVSEGGSAVTGVDVPNTDGVVFGIGGEDIFTDWMPLDGLALLGVFVEFHIGLGDVFVDAIVAVDNPKFNGRVIRGGGEELVLEWRPLEIGDVTGVTLEEGQVLVESLEVVGTEDSDGTLCGPVDSCQFTIGGETILIVLEEWHDVLKLLVGASVLSEEVSELLTLSDGLSSAHVSSDGGGSLLSGLDSFDFLNHLKYLTFLCCFDLIDMQYN
jgi:hypothetical protein